MRTSRPPDLDDMQKMKTTLLALLLLFPSLMHAENETALELIDLIGYNKRAERICENVISFLGETSLASPTKKGAKPIITIEEAKEILNYKEIENQLIEYYSINFTEEELEEMIRFWKSDLGQKTMKALDETNNQTTELFTERSTILMNEIQKRMGY